MSCRLGESASAQQDIAAARTMRRSVQIEWTRLDGRKLPTDNGRVSVRNGTLRMSPVQTSDAGDYVCVATTQAGQFTSPAARLSVLQPAETATSQSGVSDRPSFSVRPRDQTVLAGESASFDCSIDLWLGRRPSLNWRRETLAGERQSMPPPSRTRLLDNGSIIVTDVTTGDAGRYICEATSSAGAAAVESVARLTVLRRPNFVETPVDTSVALGGRAVLTCRAVGSPTPTVYWSKGLGRFLFAASASFDEADEDSSGLRVGADGSLTIWPVARSHAGQYQCHATNAVGSVQAAAQLTVEAGPSKTMPTGPKPAPVIADGPPAAVAVALGSQLHLRCKLERPVKGSQTVWIHRNPNHDGNQRQLLRAQADGSLLIASVQPADAGTYICSVDVPGFGVTEWPEAVNVSLLEGSTEPPQAPRAQPSQRPTSVEVVDAGYDWALLRIGDSCRRVYRLERLCAGIGGDRGWRRYAGLYESRLVKADNLPPETECRFLVRAVTNCGEAFKAGASWSLRQLSLPSPVSAPVRTPRQQRLRHWRRLELRGRGGDGDIDAGALGVEDLVVTSLDHSLAVATWRLRGSLTARATVVGFRVSYHPESFTTCLATATVAPAANSSAAEERLCSLNSSPAAVADHIRLSRLNVDGKSESPLPDESVDLVAAAGDDGIDEAARPRHRALLQRRLSAFTCYSVLVQPLPLGSPERQLILTREIAPSAAPSSITARWLASTGDSGQTKVLQVSWSAPGLATRNGVLTATRLYILSEEAEVETKRRQVKQLNVPAPSQAVNLTNLRPGGVYRLILSSVNCRGEGVRSAALRVLPSDASEAWLDDQQRLAASASAARGPWFLAVMACGACLWLGLCVFVAFAVRRRSWLDLQSCPRALLREEKLPTAATLNAADSFPLLLPPLLQPAVPQQQQQQQLALLSSKLVPPRAASPYASASVIRRVAGFSDEYSAAADVSAKEDAASSWDSFAEPFETLDINWKPGAFAQQHAEVALHLHHQSPHLDSCLSSGTQRPRSRYRRRRRQRRRFRQLSASTSDSDEFAAAAAAVEVAGSNLQQPNHGGLAD